MKRELSTKELVVMNTIRKDEKLLRMAYAFICGYRNGEATAKGEPK